MVKVLGSLCKVLDRGNSRQLCTLVRRRQVTQPYLHQMASTLRIARLTCSYKSSETTELDASHQQQALLDQKPSLGSLLH